MGQKDIVGKVLESYNDVFADIVNGFVFKGKKVVKEDELLEASPVSVFRTGKNIHKQERDVAKLWKENGIRIALFGIENQVATDCSMPLRVMAYDGASYKEQLINRQKNKKDKKSKSVKQTKFYPVVTFVLYLGGKAWKKGKSLLEVLDIRPEFKPFVSDYKINIIDLSEISESQAKLFKSDFRSLIDWLKKQKNQGYEIAPRKLDHPEELKQLLYFMSGDERVLTVKDNYNDEGEGITMCEFIDRLEAVGEARGKMEGKIELLANLVKDKILSLKEAAARVGMTVAKFKEASQKLATTN